MLWRLQFYHRSFFFFNFEILLYGFFLLCLFIFTYKFEIYLIYFNPIEEVKKIRAPIDLYFVLINMILSFILSMYF